MRYVARLVLWRFHAGYEELEHCLRGGFGGACIDTPSRKMPVDGHAREAVDQRSSGDPDPLHGLFLVPLIAVFVLRMVAMSRRPSGVLTPSAR